ncbi:thiolase-like protein [Tilletiaria anomala UBC 951]|uniref:Thiolase-like protein n=1 Tax=Tilletiaria anomala (strain ATCC 24038 / CBS 436.72 / UBC 951) TaxID=1037660 RepID=A0A066W1Y5_TILAU|nr:thiolase-like protein [Tilletiaria anomala UBC 951]KDN47731.1 thiolase-like protein [Tilletiaria anomala UBC 951]
MSASTSSAWSDGPSSALSRELTAKCISIINRADPDLVRFMKAQLAKVNPEQGPTYALLDHFGAELVANCEEAIGTPPVWKEVHAPTAPTTEIDSKGNIVYHEAKREGVRKLEAYVKEMAAGTRGSNASALAQVNVERAQENIAKLWTLIRNEPSVSKLGKATIKSLYSEVVRSLGQSGSATGAAGSSAAAAKKPLSARRESGSRTSIVSGMTAAPEFSIPDDRQPFLNIQRKVAGRWQSSAKLTSVYFSLLGEMAKEGLTFENKNALLTGVGKGSIGLEMVKGLLAGGARVIITTSSYSRKTCEFYQNIYQEVGSRGSSLTILPFNGASKADVQSLADYIYDTMNIDLDHVYAGAAISEQGMPIDQIGDKSELAHRLMLTNVIRLLGAIKAKKEQKHFNSRPTTIILPLSPNHGIFGGDGLYSESKIGLETLANRWSSEGWSDYLSITGACIGWVRGTGLMEQSNIVAQSLEKMGMRTFSSIEMAFNLLGLLHPVFSSVAQVEPVLADLGGGFDRIPDLAAKTASLRQGLQEEAMRKRAINLDASADFKVIKGAAAEALHQKVYVQPRANFRFAQPGILGSYKDLRSIAKLDAPIDLDKVVVCTGFAEVGPWGSARTRWEMEARGEFTIEGTIEMAWIMGFIKHHNGPLKNGAKSYVGWVDAKSGEPVEDKDIKAKYEKEITEHAGVRLIEPELFGGYDPKKKGFMQEIELNHDLEPIEVSAEEAAKFKREHGDKVDAWEDAAAGAWFVMFKKGARILVPKAIAFSRLVAGQIPTGWSGKRYGIPEDIVANVDRTTLWALVCTAEALVMSGLGGSAYELYKYVHPSHVGTSLGSGMGGQSSMHKMFIDRVKELEVSQDILQETFINTVAGWCNLLLLSSSGPVKIPVGACATGLQSIEIASETILAGKAKVMIAGGFDDLSEEGSYEFANMKATSNAIDELAAGREPSEMSRPTTRSRSGFMESQGCGVQILMSARQAIEMGCPIQGVVAYSSTHTDKQGRSIPAPGHGVMSAAAPLQKALAGWGLTADDIGVISMHGTSTVANDKNESHVYQQMFEKMGRTPGLAVPVMAQKWICGHAKGGAAAWALNGVMQSVLSSVVAGNRNADDISPELQKYTYLLYNSHSIQRTPQDLNAALVTSFGFGQVGGVILVLHPGHLLGRLSPEEHEKYEKMRKYRQGRTYARMHSALTKEDLVRVESAPPYPADLEDEVLLNLNARASDLPGGTYGFKKPLAAPPADAIIPDFNKAPEAVQQEANLSNMMQGIQGVGIDVEKVSTFPSDNEAFLQRNFTQAEIDYCRAQPDPRASFCGRFCAAEAVFKAMGVPSKGAAASMKEIEIVSTPEGPQVKLHGEAAKAAPGFKFAISLSHSEDSAVAIAHKLPA